MFWTVRKTLTLIALLASTAVLLTLFWVSQTFERFAVDTLNDASGGTVAFIVKQRVGAQYLEKLTPIIDQWSRASTIVDAAQAADKAKAARAADDPFGSAEVDQGAVKLRNIVIYANDLTVLGVASRGSGESLMQRPDLLAQLRARDTAAQRQQIGLLWHSESGRPLHSIVAPIGGFRLAGFIEYVTDPLPALDGIGSVVGGKVAILDGSGAVVFEDAAAPNAADGDRPEDVMETLAVDVPGSAGGVWAQVRVTRDIGAFVSRTHALRNHALALLGAVLLASFALGALMLRFSVLAKLRAFASAMLRISRRESGVAVPATGRDEFRTMADALATLRDMVARVLQLENMVERSPTCTALADTAGRVIFLNTAARAMLGADEETPEEAGDRSVDFFALGDDFLATIADESRLPIRREIEVGGEIIALGGDAVRGADGQHVGTMLSWTVVTALETNRRLADEIMAEVTRIAGFVAEQSRRLAAESATLAEQSERTAGQSQDAGRVAADNSGTAQAVAGATEQLTASIQEITRQTRDAQDTVSAALADAERGKDAVIRLKGSSEEIGEVVQLIDSIAAQTRLLALNATIEAARAGEVGRGFAVVASEVRTLANQTAEATQRVGAMIVNIQRGVGEATGAITDLGAVVERISAIQLTVGEAVTEQHAATAEIARNVNGFAESSIGIRKIVETVGDDATNTRRTAASLLETSRDLAREAQALSQRIAAFKERATKVA